MKREVATGFPFAALAAVSVVLLLSPVAQAQSTSTPQSTPDTPADSGAMQSQDAQAQDAQAGAAETMQMVSARVSMTATLDAGKAKQGDEIRTRLSKKVTLKNGTELPAGTTIIGIVTMDDMQMSGRSKLALNFIKAELKDGLMVPIKATIVGIYAAETQDMSGNPVAPGEEETHTWSGHPDAVDQVDALPGVDLHSKVTSSNSGVLVSTSKHDVKLKYGTEIALAVGPQLPPAVGEVVTPRQ